jgi:para-nitrobenzyl esterase
VQRELADRMNRYWAAFATHGDPTTAGLPAWPEVSTGHVQSLAPERIGGTDYEAEHSLGFWRGFAT